MGLSYESPNQFDLPALPAELRSKIYTLVFEGQRVRLRREEEEQQQQQQRLQKYDTGSALLSLQQTCRSLYFDSALISSFLGSITLSLSTIEDIELLKARLDRAHRRLIRNVCICASNRVLENSRSASPRQHASGSSIRKNAVESQRWHSLNVPLLLDTLPGLRTLDVQHDGAHINTFQWDFGFELDVLVKAVAEQKGDEQCQKFKICNDYDVTSIAHEMDADVEVDGLASSETLNSEMGSDSESDANSELIPTPMSTPSSSPWCSFSHYRQPCPLTVLSTASQTLSNCLIRTAPRFGTQWYFTLLHDAFVSDLSMTFRLELMFVSANVSCASGGNGRGSDGLGWQVVEDVTVCNQDWTMGVNGGVKENISVLQRPCGKESVVWVRWFKRQAEMI